MITLLARAVSLVIALAVPLGAGCAGSSVPRSPYAAAVDAQEPPADFWLSATVLRTPADTASRAAAYLRTPVAVRPARYVVEADRMLRVAVGSGANEETFPPETRRLTAAEFSGLWFTLRESSLAVEDSPRLIGPPPSASSVGGETWYLVGYSVAGDRRLVAVRAEPNPDPEAADAARLVEQLAGLAWMK